MLMEPALPRSRRSRVQPFAALCVASPLVLCLGWTALWFFAQREAARAMDGWIADEAAHGRQWTCPDRQITGFPFQLRFSCSAPTFHGMAGADAVDVAAAGLVASVYLYQPNAVSASLTGPLTSKTGDESPMTVSWTSLTVEGRFLAETRVRFAVLVDNGAVEHQGVTNEAAHVEIRVAPAAGTPLADHAYEVWCKLDQGILPALDAATGEGAPLSFDEKSIVTALDPAPGESLPHLVEAWRQAGGGVTLSSLAVVKGDFHAEAEGRLALDDAHRLSGKLHATTWGYEALAARFGISPRTVSMGSALSNLLNRGDNRAPAGKASIKLPISFSEGRVLIGPVVTPQRLIPLY